MSQPSDASLQEVLTRNSDGSITIGEFNIPAAPKPALTMDATSKRLMIMDMRAYDFKSFAGECHLGPFTKNFNCIVGPNGSGKSNVIDALLFVFGYRSQKIRSKRIGALIHKSEMSSDLPSCSVMVTMALIKDRGSEFVEIENSRFTIKRTGYKDNSSSYEINGRRAQYKDVAKLLKSYGVDLDYNRFMILQGEIELISQMKPKGENDQETGMLEYIEDIIGSNRFDKPMKHFYAKTEELDELRFEKMQQLKAVEKDREAAEKPRNAALKYLELLKDVALKENCIYQTEIKVVTDAGKLIEEKKVALQEEVNQMSSSLDELTKSKQSKDNELKDINKEFDTYSKTVESLKRQFSELQNEDTLCREDIESSKEKLKKLTKNLETEENKEKNLKKQPEILEGEVRELEAKKATLEIKKNAEEQKLAEVMDSVKDEIKGLQDEKDKLEEELVKRQAVVNARKSERDLSSNELEILLNSETREKEKMKAFKEDLEKVSSLFKEEEESVKKMRARIPEAKAELATAEKDLRIIEAKEVELSNELNMKTSSYEEAKSSKSKSQNKSKILKALLEQKALGNIPGVLNRLGDLGAIDQKYDVAISTACGPLDNIVVDTAQTAHTCINFLKANNLGYTTFLPLDKMQRYEPMMKRKITTPENVPRLFDLISVKNEAVLPAFYYALSDTLVADTLNQATRVGLNGVKRYRVVSLKGELVDLSGAMSGGGSKQSKGRMGTSVSSGDVSEKELENMSNEIKGLSDKLATVKTEKIKLSEIIAKTKKEVPTLEHSLKKSLANYESCKEKMNVLISQIKKQEQKIVVAAPDPKKIKELQANLSTHEKEFQSVSSSAATIEEKVKSLQDKIMSITKAKFGTVQKKVEKLVKEFDQVVQDIMKLKNMIKNHDKNLKKAEAKVKSLSAEKEDLLKKIDTAKEQLKALEPKGLDVNEKKTEAEQLLQGCEMRKALLAGEMKAITTQMQDEKSALIEHKNNLKLIDTEMKENRGHLKSLTDKLKRLELPKLGRDDPGPTEFPTLSDEEIEEINIKKLHCEIGQLKDKLKKMTPDLGAIEDYERKDELYRLKLADLMATEEERNHNRTCHTVLRGLRKEEFMEGFHIINFKVKELYRMMTLNQGDAELELIDSFFPFNEGVEFSVRPARKTWTSIRNLSGGEKTLSSLSLVFALHYYRTTPFFVMDEIDAALDFMNVSIIAAYVKDCAKNAQFIIISLRQNMIIRSDHLVGIYKTNNMTKNVYLRTNNRAEEHEANTAEPMN